MSLSSSGKFEHPRQVSLHASPWSYAFDWLDRLWVCLPRDQDPLQCWVYDDSTEVSTYIMSNVSTGHLLGPDRFKMGQQVCCIIVCFVVLISGSHGNQFQRCSAVFCESLNNWELFKGRCDTYYYFYGNESLRTHAQ